MHLQRLPSCGCCSWGAGHWRPCPRVERRPATATAAAGKSSRSRPCPSCCCCCCHCCSAFAGDAGAALGDGLEAPDTLPDCFSGRRPHAVAALLLLLLAACRCWCCFRCCRGIAAARGQGRCNHRAALQAAAVLAAAAGWRGAVGHHGAAGEHTVLGCISKAVLGAAWRGRGGASCQERSSSSSSSRPGALWAGLGTSGRRLAAGEGAAAAAAAAAGLQR